MKVLLAVTFLALGSAWAVDTTVDEEPATTTEAVVTEVAAELNLKTIHWIGANTTEDIIPESPAKEGLVSLQSLLKGVLNASSSDGTCLVVRTVEICILIWTSFRLTKFLQQQNPR